MDVITLSSHGDAAAAGEIFEHCSPGAPDDLLVRVPETTAAGVAAAVAAARAAVPVLDAMGIEARSDALAAVARTLVARRDALARLIARETGKTLRDALGEVGRAARLFDFFAGETLRIVGERFASTRKGAIVEVSYDPVGVVGAITPWNFPIAIPAWKLAPALAFGNAVVWKPSELAAATADALMAILAECLPPGAVTLVLGTGATGAALADSDLDALTFTGSEATGRRIRVATASRGLALQQEMGGVNGLIVLADADLPTAVACAVNGAFFAAGQRCTATSRIIADHKIADALVAGIAAAAGKLKIGDPRDAATDVGPLVSTAQAASVAAGVAAAEGEGLPLVFGGTAGHRGDAFFPLTLFDHVADGSILDREEIFGPVAGVVRVDGLDAALAALNAPRFGLSAGIVTTSLASAEAFKRRARAGMAMVNLPTAGVDYHAPFGGVAASSFGAREQGRAARGFYTATRTIYQAA